jgi:2,4-dienoyl-CoA reductase-like NADH-dependent reductase (Old Yellow Enzyme family)
MTVIFERSRIKGMELPNRLVRSATAEGMADENGFPSDSLFELYERLAQGGVGLIITGYAFTSLDGRCAFPGMSGIDRDEQIPRYRDLVDLVHENGAAIAMQIVHCGRQTKAETIGAQPIAPSAVEDTYWKVVPREMTEVDIERVINDFAEAGRRVQESGFDAVQIHGAHGYLVNQFLCPHTNRRRDKWGGPIDNRMRFLREIIQQMQSEVGEDFPILIKMNAQDGMEDGISLQEGLVMAEMMAEMGFDGIEVSRGISEDGGTDVFGDAAPGGAPEQAYNRAAARAIKNRVNVPVFVVGGITDPVVMEDIIEQGDADYISMSRALIADPEFPNKIRAGGRAISRCTRCDLCLDDFSIDNPLHCYDWEYD